MATFEGRVAADAALDTRVDALEAGAAGVATLAGDNVFTGKNRLQKVLTLGKVQTGNSTPGSTPSFGLTLDTAPVIDLVGQVIFLTGYLEAGVTPPAKWLVTNPNGYTWGVSYPVKFISAVGAVTNYTATEAMTAAVVAEIIWTGTTVILKAWSV